ncbi:MAG TPA: hypothetical protein DEH78_23775 [Solibacterales bacterium]|nr:hypothetical protein [Bryobacterales bacterium]
MQPQSAPAGKSTSPLKIILIVLAVFIVLGVAAVLGIGWFTYSKMKEAGVDAELMQRNPALATAKIAAAFNPNIEVLSVDERTETVQIREKSTGKVTTVKLGDLKQGKITVQDNEGNTVSVGGEVKLPDWAPPYPGAKQTGTASVQGAEGEAGNVVMQTSDSLEKVFQFYEEKLKAGGFKTTVVNKAEGAWTLAAADDAGKRSLNIVGNRQGDETSVTLTFTGK